MLEKLKQSGLDKHVKELGYKELKEPELRKLFPRLPFFKRAMVIPYYGIDKKPSKFFRVRYLEDTRTPMEQKTTKKPTRYAQLPATTNELYLPKTEDWAALSKDTTTSLIITEGELKAACACIHGFPTIGLGGVWCWRSAKQNQPVLEQFLEFKWEGREVFIAYDSDAASNPKVIQAENALAEALSKMGARVYILRLPPMVSGAKQGLDDFLVGGGSLEHLTNGCLEYNGSQALHKMNEEVVYVRDPGLILRLDNLQKMAPSAFCEHAFSTRTFTVQVTNGKDTKLETKSTPREWLRWPNRSEVKRLTYAPGEDRVTSSNELNLWPGWKVDPMPGDVKPWNDLLNYLFKPEPRGKGWKDDGTEARLREGMRWMEQWLAYPLQYPGVKLGTSVVLWGVHHGTGKSAIGYTMMEIYGQNATEIKDRDLSANHNEWAENRQFVMGDEISGGDKRASADRMKSMITQRELRLNPKYIPSYVVPDVINYYFTSNHPDAFFLEDTDRRYFIHEVKGMPEKPDFYRKYFHWLHKENGAAKLFHHLLNVDTHDFNPLGHAPMTDAKKSMIADVQSDLGAWVRAFLEDPQPYLEASTRFKNATVLTSEEVKNIYDPEGKARVTANGISRAMLAAGAFRVFSGNAIRTKLGQVRLWAITPKSLEYNPGQAAKAYEEERIQGGRKF